MRIIHRLDRFQKGLLLVMLAMILIFAVVYPLTMKIVGIRYQDKFLVAKDGNGSTTFSEPRKGQQLSIITYDHGAVEFHINNRHYGPYTAKKDPSAIPAQHQYANHMTGLEIREGEHIVFRGGYFYTSGVLFLYNEDGASVSNVTITSQTGSVYDENGVLVDQTKPSIGTILMFLEGPELTHRGTGIFWFLGLFLCIINAISICFAEQLFYFYTSLRWSNPHQAHPSQLYIASRCLSWIIIVCGALYLFIIGLR